MKLNSVEEVEKALSNIESEKSPKTGKVNDSKIGSKVDSKTGQSESAITDQKMASAVTDQKMASAKTELKQITREEQKEKLKNFLYKSLDKAAQARKRLYKKAKIRGYDTDLINECLDHFEHIGIINDRVLAESVINVYTNNPKKMSRFAIMQKLLQRDINYSIAQELTDKINDDDLFNGGY
jgi:SOS response regulatory protein OraA/RecX